MPSKPNQSISNLSIHNLLTSIQLINSNHQLSSCPKETVITPLSLSLLNVSSFNAPKQAPTPSSPLLFPLRERKEKKTPKNKRETKMRFLIPAVVLGMATVVVSAVCSGVLPLERLSHRVEMEELRARDRVRHARILRGVVGGGGVVDFSVQGTSDPYSVGYG